MAVNAPAVAKSSPYFSNQWKSTLTLLFQNKPSAPGITYDVMSRLITFERAQGWGLGGGRCHGGQRPCFGKNSPYFSINEKVNWTICFEQTERTRHRKWWDEQDQSVDQALERHGRRKRPWRTRGRVEVMMIILWLEDDFICSLKPPCCNHSLTVTTTLSGS